MNPFKRGDTVWHKGERYTVATTDGDDVLIQSIVHNVRKRVDYRNVSADF